MIGGIGATERFLIADADCAPIHAPTVARYATDPAFAAEVDADQRRRQAEVDATARQTMEAFWARQALPSQSKDVDHA